MRGIWPLSFILVAYFQLLASTVSTKGHRWDPFPIYSDFKHFKKCKDINHIACVYILYGQLTESISYSQVNLPIKSCLQTFSVLELVQAQLIMEVLIKLNISACNKALIAKQTHAHAT